MITQIYHKKNELFEVNFFEDAECTIPFDFTGKKHLYIELVNGDVTPLVVLGNYISYHTIYTPYIGNQCWNSTTVQNNYIITLDDITPNLSKYIPKDNAVLFLSEDDCIQYRDCFYPLHHGYMDGGKLQHLTNGSEKFKKFIIFLRHGTQSELQKAKELKEKYGVEEVNLFVLRCYVQKSNQFGSQALFIYKQEFYQKECVSSEEKQYIFNKIITTNSTGILKPEDSSERLQVIDSKEIFEEFLKENN